MVSDGSEGERAGGVDDVVCAWANEDRSRESEPYAGIICDSWMVTLIKEAAFPERCVVGVDEACEASVCGVRLGVVRGIA